MAKSRVANIVLFISNLAHFLPQQSFRNHTQDDRSGSGRGFLRVKVWVGKDEVRLVKALTQKGISLNFKIHKLKSRISFRHLVWLDISASRLSVISGPTRCEGLSPGSTCCLGVNGKISKDLLRGRLMTWSVSPCENKWCCKTLLSLGGETLPKLMTNKKKERRDFLFMACFLGGMLLNHHLIPSERICPHPVCFYISLLKVKSPQSKDILNHYQQFCDRSCCFFFRFRDMPLGSLLASLSTFSSELHSYYNLASK